MTSPSVGLYVHIPFCDARCHYCDFVTFADRHDRVDSYLSALVREMDSYPGLSLKTIFVGGGTPSVLNPRQIQFLFDAIRSRFQTNSLEEVTVEANPESATSGRLAAFHQSGVNRVSFGLQATQNQILSSLGRLHSFEKFQEAFHAARSVGFTNINVDLIYGLPGQSFDMWLETLSTVVALQPEHISGYGLKVEKGTRFDKDGVCVDDDLEADMYLAASEKLVQAGYSHYEISNFARPGFEGRHNLLYWTNAPTVGLGISSASYINGKRFKNSTRLETYIDKAARGEFEREAVELPAEESRNESLMLQLRLKTGVPITHLDRLRIPLVEKFLQNGLARTNNGVFSLTPKGWLVSNQLFQHLVS